MPANTLHIALVSETFPPEINGVANTLGRLCQGLRERGHRLQLVRPRQSSDAKQSSSDELILIRGWPLPGYRGLQWGQAALRKLLRRWRQQRPDVLYIATEGPLGFSALRAAKRLAIPVISGFHTNFQQYTSHYGLSLLSRLATSYLRWFHNSTHMTLVPSPSQRMELQRRGFERLGLLARGVDSKLFHPSRRSAQLRQSWGLGEDDLALIHVGRLAMEKNLALLTRSYRALRLAYPERNLKLVLIGDGPLAEELRQELPDAIFCGVQRGEALAEHYASGDLFLFPSLSETFGNVVLEALASGLAVVAFDQAAAALHIRHGHSGALAAPGDEHAVIEAAQWLVDDAETRRRVRLNARQHAGRQGWPSIVEQFEHYLQTACLLPADAQPAAPAGASSERI